MRILLPLLALLACTAPDRRDRDNDGFRAEDDCDDRNPDVNPDQFEVPYDGLDNDCRADTPDTDLDGDGLEPPADCDDQDPDVRPGRVELAYDGLDNDCDENTPDDDLDGDGVGGDLDCNDNAPGIFPGNTEIYYDGIDNDCDPLTTPDDDQDNDGVPVDEDCDDLSPTDRAGLLFYVDCDEDGFAPSTEDAVQACVVPVDPPAVCGDGGAWTLIEPVGPAFDPLNTTVDCGDDDPDAHPDQTDWFASQTLALPPGSTFDYDCSGDHEPEYDLFSCMVQPGTVPNTTVCIADDGFDSDVACGVVATLQTGCVESADADNGCRPANTAPVVRACH